MVKNYETFKERFFKYVGDETTFDTVKDYLGVTDEEFLRASYGATTNSGYAYEGSLIRVILDIATYAYKLNSIIPAGKSGVNVDSLLKVCLIHQLSKVIMYEKNTNQWEVEKRGMIYTYNNLEGALKTGERSALIALSCGISLTPIEYEAIHSIDKVNDVQTDVYGNIMSTILKTAIEIVQKCGEYKNV